VIRRWFWLVVAQAIVRVIARSIALLLLVVGAVAAAPVTVVAAGAFAVAWWRGLLPRRLLIAAAWCGPMVVVWLGLTASRAADPVSAVTAPYHAWLAFWRLANAGAIAAAAATVAPVAIPLGLLAGAACWFYRIRSLAAGAGGLSPAAAAAFDQRQWRHQARAARARIAAPGALPLTRRGDLILVGGVIRTVGHRAGAVAAIGYQRMRSHQVVIGTTGTGKTTLLLRLWAGFMATGLRRQAAGVGPPPLLVVLDCKGGSDARRIADRFRRVMREAGARSTSVWPDEGQLVAVDAAAAPAYDHAGRPDRARHRFGRLLHRRHGGADRPGRRGAVRAAGQQPRPAGPAGTRLAVSRLRGRRHVGRPRDDQVGWPTPE